MQSMVWLRAGRECLGLVGIDPLDGIVFGIKAVGPDLAQLPGLAQPVVEQVDRGEGVGRGFFFWGEI